MVLHIPHSSTIIPEENDPLNLSDEDFNLMTDWFTHELFHHPYSSKVIFNISRLYCDVERFRDDNLEQMASKGHGVVYTMGATNNKIRENLTQAEYIKKKYYDKHHLSLTQTINKNLSLFPKVVLVDCHSFSDTPLIHEDSSNRPDFCIGINEGNKPPFLDDIISLITQEGYSVLINDPFSGVLVPELFLDNSDVKAIMIEVNRKLYLTNNYTKNKDFDNIQQLITNILNVVSKYEEENDI